MKKTLIIISLVIVTAVGGTAIYITTRPSGAVASKANTTTNATALTPAQEQGQPARAAEIKGIVKSIEGNELLVANEIDTVELTAEQQAAKKAERQAMSQEERQALKAQETAAAKIENTNLLIPVGVPIKKTTGDATGQLVSSDLAEIKAGMYISVWADDYKSDKQSVVFVKLRATTN